MVGWPPRGPSRSLANSTAVCCPSRLSENRSRTTWNAWTLSLFMSRGQKWLKGFPVLPRAELGPSSLGGPGPASGLLSPCCPQDPRDCNPFAQAQGKGRAPGPHSFCSWQSPTGGKDSIEDAELAADLKRALSPYLHSKGQALHPNPKAMACGGGWCETRDARVAGSGGAEEPQSCPPPPHPVSLPSVLPQVRAPMEQITRGTLPVLGGDLAGLSSPPSRLPGTVS